MLTSIDIPFGACGSLFLDFSSKCWLGTKRTKLFSDSIVVLPVLIVNSEFPTTVASPAISNSSTAPNIETFPLANTFP